MRIENYYYYKPATEHRTWSDVFLQTIALISFDVTCKLILNYTLSKPQVICQFSFAIKLTNPSSMKFQSITNLFLHVKNHISSYPQFDFNFDWLLIDLIQYICVKLCYFNKIRYKYLFKVLNYYNVSRENIN